MDRARQETSLGAKYDERVDACSARSGNETGAQPYDCEQASHATKDEQVVLQVLAKSSNP
jgi:hypothetical protein